MAIDVMFHISCSETWCAVMASDEGQPEFGAAPILFRIQSFGACNSLDFDRLLHLQQPILVATKSLGVGRGSDFDELPHFKRPV